MVLGKSVICLVVAPHIAKLSCVREGALLAVENLDRLGNAVQMALSDPVVRVHLAQARQRFLSRHLGYADGCSAERVARLIESLLGEAGCLQQSW